jgi:hypothetical protein
MSAQKFEKLIDLIINENQEQAEQLFHDIIVEKSREIYESIISEDASMGLLDEIQVMDNEDEGMSGMMEADDEESVDEVELGMDDGEEGEFGDEEAEFGDEEAEFGDEEGEGDLEDLEDRVVDLEEKLDQLMAEFEAEMGSDEGGEEEFGDEEGGEEEMDMDMDMDMGDEEGDEVMESAQLKQVGGKTYDKFGKMGDNGDQTKSPTLQNPKRLETGGKPVKFDGAETVPTSAKKPSNIYSKGEKEEDFGNINKVGGNAGKTAFKTKAPAPKSEDPGKSKSPVAESKKTAKRRI